MINQPESARNEWHCQLRREAQVRSSQERVQNQKSDEADNKDEESIEVVASTLRARNHDGQNFGTQKSAMIANPPGLLLSLGKALLLR